MINLFLHVGIATRKRTYAAVSTEHFWTEIERQRDAETEIEETQTQRQTNRHRQ